MREKSLKNYRQKRRGGRGHKDKRHAPPRRWWPLDVINGFGDGKFKVGMGAEIIAEEDTERRVFVYWSSKSYHRIGVGGWEEDIPTRFTLYPSQRMQRVATTNARMRAEAHFATLWKLTVIGGTGSGFYPVSFPTITATPPAAPFPYRYDFVKWDVTQDAHPEIPAVVDTQNPTVVGLDSMDMTAQASFALVLPPPPVGASYTVLPSGWCGFDVRTVALYWNVAGHIEWYSGFKSEWTYGDLCASADYGYLLRAFTHTDTGLVPHQQPSLWTKIEAELRFPNCILSPINRNAEEVLYLTCRVETIVGGVHTQDVTVTVSRHAPANLNWGRVGMDSRLVVAGAQNYPAWPSRLLSFTLEGGTLEMVFTGGIIQRITLSVPRSKADRDAEALAGLYTLQPGQQVTVGNGEGPQD